MLFLILVFACFRGMRWETGTDWNQYLYVFTTSSWANIFSFGRELGDFMEPGYVLLNVLVKLFGGGYTTFLLVTNLFILSSYAYISLKGGKYPIFSFVSILLSVGFFPVRQNLAVAVLLFSYEFIRERRFCIFLLLVLLASSIHYYSFLFVIMYFLRDKRISLFVSLGLLLGALLISVYLNEYKWEFHQLTIFLPPSIYDKIGIYLGYGVENGRSWTEIVSIFVFYIISSLYVENVKSSVQTIQRLRIFLNSTLIMYITRFLFINFGDLSRLSDFFSIVCSVLLVHAIIYSVYYYNAHVKKMWRIVPLYVISFFFFYRFMRISQYFPDLMFPYKSIFECLNIP